MCWQLNVSAHGLLVMYVRYQTIMCVVTGKYNSTPHVRRGGVFYLTPMHHA